MSYKSRFLLSVVTALCMLGYQANAQEWRADPILFESQTDSENQEPLLVVTFTPQDAAPAIARAVNSVAALVPDPALPSPSIILGRVDIGQEAAFGILRLLPTTVSQVRFDHGDLDARRALKAENPVLFGQLIAEGHIDPPAEILAAAVQTELARMNCYRSRIDNDWGRGSRRAVTAYFSERDDVDWSDQSASPELFRTIIVAPDVACPTPVVAAPARRPVQQQPARPRVQQPTAPPPPPPPPQPPASTGPTLNIGGSTGVFR